MKFHIIGENGNIGTSMFEHIKDDYVENITESDVIILCVNSTIAKEYIEIYHDTKIILNFSSYKPELKNVINGLGCSTLSVLLPLLQIQDSLTFISQPINVVTLFPQSAISNNSKYKFKENNIPIYTLSHNHQDELESILKKDVNMSHFITPASSSITSNISITFDKKVNLFEKLEGYQAFTRDYINWTIISIIDNIEEPIKYMLLLLDLYTKTKEN